MNKTSSRCKEMLIAKNQLLAKCIIDYENLLAQALDNGLMSSENYKQRTNTKTNSLKAILSEKEKDIKSQLKQLDIYEENLEFSNCNLIQRTFSNSETEIKHFSFNPEPIIDSILNYNKSVCNVEDGEKSSTSSKKSAKGEKKQFLLHPVEVKLFQSLFKSQEKVAIVDIFARKDKGEISIEERSNLPKMHCVMIFRNTSESYVIIDSSNSEFSNHFSWELNNLLVSDNVKIATPDKEIRIYTPKSTVGGNPHDFRDCVDISLKLAYSFKEFDFIDATNIGNLKPIMEISNNSTTVPGLFNDGNASLRIRQSSDSSIREKSNELFKDIEAQFKWFNKCPKQNVKLRTSIMRDKYINGTLNKISSLTYDNYEGGIKALESLQSKVYGNLI